MNTRDIRFRSNRVADIAALFHKELDGLYGRGEAGTQFEMLCEEFLGWDRVRLMTSREQTVDQSDLLRFHWALEDLKRHRPIQHIIGHTAFCGCRIGVNPDVLIPRPETEEMVRWCIAQFADVDAPAAALDLCTGSGCIAIALKRAWPQTRVEAVDVSAAALATAQRNAEANGTEVRFLQANLLDMALPFRAASFRLVVSNPPYVMEGERALMHRNVLDYEPPQALFVPDDDPLRFYRAVADTARRCLAADGLLVVEINEALAGETCSLLHGYGFRSAVHDDFRGKPRYVSASWNP